MAAVGAHTTQRLVPAVALLHLLVVALVPALALPLARSLPHLPRITTMTATNIDYHFKGQFSQSDLQILTDKNIKSIVYFATDKGDDKSYLDGGFEALQNTVDTAIFAPFDSSAPEFQPTDAGLEVPWQRVLAYKRFEHAMQSAPLPVALVCKSARRAGAVYSAFRGVTGRLTKEQAIEAARNDGQSFVESAGMKAWVEGVVDALSRRNPLIFRQLFEAESSTYTYLLADAVTKDAVLIDPVLETVDRDYKLLQDLGLNLKYMLNTHVHADHISGTGKMKERVPTALSVLTERKARADVYLNEYEPLEFGTWKIYPIRTPGHTDGCTSFALDDLSRVFTGDALLIRGCGRTDFQGGSAATLYSSIHDKLFKYLPDQCLVYPAHDYKGNSASSVYEEKTFNPRLTKTLEEFVHIMNNLNLAAPKKLDISVPANLLDGLPN